MEWCADKGPTKASPQTVAANTALSIWKRLILPPYVPACAVAAAWHQVHKPRIVRISGA